MNIDTIFVYLIVNADGRLRYSLKKREQQNEGKLVLKWGVEVPA